MSIPIPTTNEWLFIFGVFLFISAGGIFALGCYLTSDYFCGDFSDKKRGKLFFIPLGVIISGLGIVIMWYACILLGCAIFS